MALGGDILNKDGTG